MTPAVGAATEYVRVAEIEKLPMNRPFSAQLNDLSICLIRTEHELLAFEDKCPHRGHPLSEGKCVDGVLRCALHGWEFSIPEGNAVSPRAPFGLALLETRIANGHVEVKR